MKFKKQSNLKINEYSKRDNESKILKSLNEIDYGKMVIGLGGLSVCIPYMFPSISTNQILSLIPTISSNIISLGLMSIGGISTYNLIDILSKSLKDKELETQKYEVKDTVKANVKETNTNTNDLILNLNKQLLECSIDKDEF